MLDVTSPILAGQECGPLALGVFFKSPKKYRPPRPMGVKGGCSPQNNLPKSAQLLAELKGCRNKNFYKLSSHFSRPRASQILRHEGCRSRRSSMACLCFFCKPRILAESDDARLIFTCATCARKNRAASPDHFWSRIRTCSTQTFGAQCSLFRRMILRTARSE